MNRLEYKQSGQPGSYVVYQVNVAPGERILLEVGQESGEYRGTMPTPMIGCSTGIFDARMVENINRGLDEVFVVNQLSSGGHTISQVSLAGAYQFNQRMIAFDSPKYQFRFDLENGTVGENIAASGTQREVFFQGRMEEQCLGAYIFQQNAPRSPKPHMDMVFIPNVGIVEERAGFTLDEALSNAIKLDNINGIPYQSYLLQMCNQGGNTTSSSLVLQPYSAEVTPAQVFKEQPDMSVKGMVPNSPAPTSTAPAPTSAAVAQQHTIAVGETLYSISKKYGVSVNQLKQWNGLKSNTIYKGKQLVVSDPASNPAVSTTASKSSAYIASSNPGGSTPVPYDENGQRINVTAKGVNTGQDVHIVHTGETVAMIARKYGYTEERFREINGLKANEYPKIGQALKTTDCDCPDLPEVNSTALTAKSINPYTPGAVPANASLQAVAPSTPVNNYSYPSPTAYDNTGQAINPNARPFSSYNDTPVPAAGSSTAPTNYNNGSYGTSNPVNYNQPSDYSNYNTGVRGLSDSNSNSYQQSTSLKRSHVVKENETLYDIARIYGTTVEKLRQLNHLDANEVLIPNKRIFLE